MRWIVAAVLMGGCHSGNDATPTVDGASSQPDAGSCRAPHLPPPPAMQCAHPWFPGELSVTGAGAEPYDGRFAAGDLDRDGQIDLAVPVGGFKLVVLHGEGLGRFAAPVEYAVGYGSRQAVIADLDGDSWPDIASLSSTQGPGTVSVLRNTGGPFAPAVAYEVGNVPVSLASGDADSDGAPELFVANGGSASGSVTVLRNDGDGEFGMPRTYPTSSAPVGGAQFVAVADVNGDGRLDIVAAHGNGSVAVLLGRPSGFAAGVSYAAGANARSVAIADVSGDGAADLVVTVPFASSTSGAIAVLRNTGNGVFAAPVHYATRTEVRDVAIADLDEDGDRDLIAPYDGGPTVFINQGDGTFAALAALELGWGSTIAVAEIDGNSKPDILLNFGGSVGAFFGDGAGGVLRPERISPASDTHIFVRDVNGDGLDDLLGSFGTMLRKADGTFASPLPTPPGSEYRVDDIDGDGTLDLLVLQRGSPGAIQMWRGTGDGTFASWTTYAPAGEPMSIATGDLDGDCRIDVVVGHGDLTDLTLGTTALLNRGDGMFDMVTDSKSGILTKLGDVNKDGFADLFGEHVRPTVTLSIGNGDGTFGVETVVAQGPLGAVVDVNRDGNLDLVSGGVRLGDGLGGFGPSSATIAGHDLEVGDVDGNGNLDLVAGDSVTFGHGDGTFGPPLSSYWLFGASSKAISDLDRDGLNDVITSTGLVLRQRCLP